MRAGSMSRSTLRPRRRFARGFSLLELTLVLAIIGILMSVAAFSIIGQGEKAKVRASQATIKTIKAALEQYNLENSTYPPDLRALVSSKFLENKKIQDGWKHDLYYNAQGRSKEQPFILGSMGPDGQMGNEDDINVWTMEGAGSN